MLHGSRGPGWLSAIETGTGEFRTSRAEVGLKPWGDFVLEPLPGRVYLTSSEDKAVAYAQADLEGDPIVLDVLLPEGASVVPDEDCVAEVLARAYGFDVEDMCGWGYETVDEHPELKEHVRHVAENVIDASALQQLRHDLAKDDEGSALALLLPAAKVVALSLDDDAVQSFIELGSNLAAKPPLTLLGGWVFDQQTWDLMEQHESDELGYALYVQAGSAQPRRGIGYTQPSFVAHRKGELLAW